MLRLSAYLGDYVSHERLHRGKVSAKISVAAADIPAIASQVAHNT